MTRHDSAYTTTYPPSMVWYKVIVPFLSALRDKLKPKIMKDCGDRTKILQRILGARGAKAVMGGILKSHLTD